MYSFNLLMMNHLICAVIVLIFLCGKPSLGQNTVVNTKYGFVEGHTVETHNGQSVLSFLGIPFARPPVDNLRWAVSIEETIL